MADDVVTFALARRGPTISPATPPVLAALAACVLYAATVVASLVDRSAFSFAADDVVWFGAWLVCAIAGGVLARSAAGRRYGWLMLTIGLGAQTAAVAGVLGPALLRRGEADGLAEALLLARSVLADLPQALLLGFGVLVFPDGRLPSPSRRWRAVAIAAAACTAVLLVGDLVKSGRLDDGAGRTNPLGVPALHAGVHAAQTVVFVGLVIVLVVSLVALIARWRRGTGAERTAIALFATAALWLVASGLTELTLALAGHDSPSLLGSAAEGLAICSLPLASLTTTMRRQLFDAEVVLNRNLTYLAVTVVVVAGYAVAVTILGTLFDSRSAFGISLLVTGVIAVVFGPLKLAAERAVGYLLLGRRMSPYGALTTLGRRIDVSLSPDEALEAAVRTVAETFRLPYVELVVDVEREARTVAAHGTPTATPIEVALVHRGRRSGTLRLAPRSPNERLTGADERLLADFAARIAGAVEAVHLTEQLRRSRTTLVQASEEERRRIRRELHDGIGPVLASTALAVQRVERQLGADDERRNALSTTRLDVQDAINDIRRLVNGLGPASLDELGLVAAVRQRAAALSDHVAFTVEATAPLAGLPAAVEVAAYRVATEAMTNVVRHAGATICTVRLAAVDAGLEVTISDDGVGAGADAIDGVGMASMRERVSELGGRVTVSSDGSGMQVRAWLPAL
ncbi:sensor histidine kinase [uncultured Jatrophihabitans sp.]|uniref:sensor histidine kinase n=1 Tax=uncultured Jatrophihabitans sp. TaxID=1610747 RepID=UPI0035CA165E